MYKSIVLASLIALATVADIKATEPSIRLEGNGEAVEYPLSTRNRVYFNTNYMSVGSRTNTDIQPVTWAYSTYNVIRVTQLQSSITAVSDDRPVLKYINGSLKLSAANPEAFICTVYDAKGSQIISKRFDPDGILTINGLPEGIYFATTTDSNDRHTVKFIVR